MPVNNTHPEYDAAPPDWLRARDVLAGEDAVKSAGEKYLSRLDSQSDEEFLAYRKRASFFNATARTAEWYIGLIFRRPPFIKIQKVLAGRAPMPAVRTLNPDKRHRDFADSASGHRSPKSTSPLISFDEPSNEYAAPMELGEGSRGVGSYRHGAPTELFKSVHGPSACATRREAFHEPSNERAAPMELGEDRGALAAIDMALLRSFSMRFIAAAAIDMALLRSF